MNAALYEQLGIALFGLTAMWMGLGHIPWQRKVAPLIGLAGQPFWLAFALRVESQALYILVPCYAAVYIRGVWLQWGPKPKQPPIAYTSRDREYEVVLVYGNGRERRRVFRRRA